MTDIQMVVFDLDFTLWDCDGTWCDHTSPPYRRCHPNHADEVQDSAGRTISLYPDVRRIIDDCHQKGLTLALASRTYQPTWAKQLLQLFEIDRLFDVQQIFPDSKRTHFANIEQQTGICYANMLFFDDEMRNVRDVNSLGVRSVLVENGINWQLYQQHIAKS